MSSFQGIYDVINDKQFCNFLRSIGNNKLRVERKKKKLIYKKYRDLVSFLILFFSFPISCCIVLELRKKRTRDDEFSAFSKIMLNG